MMARNKLDIETKRVLTIRCTYVNQSKAFIYAEDDQPQVAFTNNRGELFRALQSEFGTCTGKCYRSFLNDRSTVIGYTFEQKVQYSDYQGKGERFYIQETWVDVRRIDMII